MLEFFGVLRDFQPGTIRTYQIEAESKNVSGNSVLIPRLQGENMQSILRIFQGIAPLAGAPEQVFETTATAAGTSATPATGAGSGTTPDATSPEPAAPSPAASSPTSSSSRHQRPTGRASPTRIARSTSRHRRQWSTRDPTRT
jgi:hypothetical protein